MRESMTNDLHEEWEQRISYGDKSKETGEAVVKH